MPSGHTWPLRSVEEAKLLQCAFEVTREIFEDVVEKGLLTLWRV
jgi:hypothetical protein